MMIANIPQCLVVGVSFLRPLPSADSASDLCNHEPLRAAHIRGRVDVKDARVRGADRIRPLKGGRGR